MTSQPSSPANCNPTTLELIPVEERRQLYEYVSEQGPVQKEHLEETLFPYDPRALCQHLTLLKQQGFLVEDGEQIHSALDISSLPQRQEITLEDDRAVTIRPATQRDRSELLETIEQVTAETTYIEGEALATRLDQNSQVLRDSENDIQFFYVATIDGSIQGWSHVSSTSCRGFDHVGTITGGVTKPFQKKGLGNNLITYCLDWANSNGYTKLYQNLRETNQGGIDFLKSHGWSIEGNRSNHYRIDEEYHDQVILSYEFSRS